MSSVNSFAALRSLSKKKRPSEVLEATSVEDASIQALESAELLPPAKRLKEAAYTDFLPSKTNVSCGSDLALIALATGERLNFHGTVSACPILGSFSVLGAVFTASKDLSALMSSASRKGSPGKSRVRPAAFQFFPCHSPRSSSFLCLQAEETPSSRGASYGNAEDDKIGGDKESADKFLNQLLALRKQLPDGAKTLIALKGFSWSGICGVERMMPVYRELFSSNEKSLELDGFGILTSDSDAPAPSLNLFDDWHEFSANILKCELPTVCVIGSKGVGKSSAARFLTNRLLQRHPQIAYLDCDIGQPELSPIGTVALHIVDRPLLGPSFTHILPSYRSIIIGATSPKNDPDWYMACVQELHQVYKSELAPKGLPLIINTDGWVRLMGLDLLKHLLQSMIPTHVVQLSATSAVNGSKNIQADISGLMASCSGGTSTVFEITAFDSESTRAPKFNSADLRTLNSMFYFARSESSADVRGPFLPWRSQQKLWNFDLPLAARVPYQVPWGCVRIKFFGSEVPFSQTLYALNGTLVSLAIDSRQYAQKQQKSDLQLSLSVIPPTVSLMPHSLHCLGFGVIRAIDVDAQVFYVSTPLPEKDLQNVNTLIRIPGVELPVALLVKGFEGAKAALPYLTYTVAEGLGSLARRTRHDIKRRKNL